jgi:prepilin-type processing-associated H-X9-DG protein
MSPDHIRLDNLGSNRDGQPIRALVIDSQFLVPSGFDSFGVRPRTHHQQECANVLYSDGHAVSRPNADGRFTVNLDNYQALTNAFDRILGVLERADTEP